MLSKRYESTEVDRRTWLHVPSGTHWSTSSDTHQVVEIQIETSTKMYTPFLNRIEWTTWTICAFRVLNPRQWSWAKQVVKKLLTQGCRYHKLREKFGKFFRSYSELLSKFGAISIQDYVSKGITHPVFYGDLVYKLRRVKSDSNLISSGSKIVKRLRRRQYDPEIIERTIGLVLGPFTALYRSFLKRCTLTNKAVGTI